MIGRPRVDPAVRFEAMVDRTGPGLCHLWTGTANDGYGHFWTGERRTYAHRWAWERAHGPIPDGMQIDHLCRVRRCVNVEHLEVVTPRENTMRADSPPARFARATTCAHGHPLAVVGNRRRCRICDRAKYARYRARKKLTGATA